MKNLGTAFAIAATLFLAQGCSQPNPSKETQANQKELTKNHEMNGMNHEGHSMDGMHHNEHSMGSSESKTGSSQAKLTIISEKIAPNTLVPFTIDVQDSAGKAIAKFDRFQEKLMHLIVVSDDLQSFNHLHPAYKENGRFAGEITFPQPGNYTFFSDYKPTGAQEQVSALKAQVAGTSSPPPAVDLKRTKTFGDTKVNLTFSETTLKSGKDVNLMFNLEQADNNQPIKDLKPYLGEKGHLVIVQHSSNLSKANYLHAHALKDAPNGQVHFMTQFPQPGNYKVWGQFNRNGKIVTADFWLNVL